MSSPCYTFTGTILRIMHSLPLGVLQHKPISLLLTGLDGGLLSQPQLPGSQSFPWDLFEDEGVWAGGMEDWEWEGNVLDGSWNLWGKDDISFLGGVEQWGSGNWLKRINISKRVVYDCEKFQSMPRPCFRSSAECRR